MKESTAMQRRRSPPSQETAAMFSPGIRILRINFPYPSKNFTILAGFDAVIILPTIARMLPLVAQRQ
jgi:hypothetical protein